jgi:hypothetical protein
MSCCTGICSCYLDGLRQGRSEGFVFGVRAGYVAGYVDGYVDRSLGVPPPRVLREPLQAYLPPPQRKLSCGCYGTCSCYGSALTSAKLLLPEPLPVRRTCYCVGFCSCFPRKF